MEIIKCDGANERVHGSYMSVYLSVCVCRWENVSLCFSSGRSMSRECIVYKSWRIPCCYHSDYDESFEIKSIRFGALLSHTHILHMHTHRRAQKQSHIQTADMLVFWRQADVCVCARVLYCYAFILHPSRTLCLMRTHIWYRSMKCFPFAITWIQPNQCCVCLCLCLCRRAVIFGRMKTIYTESTHSQHYGCV